MIMSFVAKAEYWIADPYKYANNMTVVGVVSFSGEEQGSEFLEIGAFCGDECRGSSMASYQKVFDRYYFFLMIYGEHNDEISFRCYDHRLNLELELIPETLINFQSNAMLGGVVDPFVFSFQTYQHTISLDILPEIGGVVTGTGVYDKYDTCFINITPNPGYQLDAIMEDGDTLTKQTYYSFIVMSDRHFDAEFAIKEYQISLSADPEIGGFVSGAGTYLHAQTVYAIAQANDNYVFEKWTDTDGAFVSSNNQYIFEAKEDLSLVAHFRSTESMDKSYVNDLLLYPNTACGFININGLEKETDVVIYDYTGRMILKKSLSSGDNIIDVSNIPNGTYIISIDNKNYKLTINN